MSFTSHKSQVFHVAELGDTCVDRSDVVRAGSWGVVCEGKTLLETAGEELVRDPVQAPVKGYKRKISVHALEPQLREPGRTRTKTW